MIRAAVAMVVLASSSAATTGEAGAVSYLALTDGIWQVWTIDPANGTRRQVTRSDYEKASVSWFPDGASLLVNALDGRLFRVERASGAETAIALPVGGATDAVVAPDGRTIAFSFSGRGTVDANEIWKVDLDGTGLRQLTDLPRFQHQPRWSADGDWLYFLSASYGQNHDIWRLSTRTGAREQLTAGALYHFELAVARDGRLAYSSNRSGDYELYAETPAGTSQRLTHAPGLDGHPTWSPDGETLVFHSSRSGELALWQVPATGGRATPFVEHSGGARNPVWWHPPGEAP